MQYNNNVNVKKTERIKTKDLITLGILNAVMIGLIFTIGIFISILPVTYIFLPAVAAVPIGVVFMLLLARVPKTGVFIISGTIQAGVYLLIGSLWPLVLGVFLGSALAELVVLAGSYKRFRSVAAGFVVFILGYALGAFAPAVFAADLYIDIIAGSGYASNMSYYEELLSLLSVPVLLIVIAASIAGALIGSFLGKKLLHKHFVKAGIV